MADGSLFKYMMTIRTFNVYMEKLIRNSITYLGRLSSAMV